MTKVFIGGSRHMARLNVQVRERLDTILNKGFPIIIGDANGADKAVQKYLFGKKYTNVEVFCSDGICRNNVGSWAVRSVPVRSRERTADFYYVKDRAMAEEATVGLMMWDGQSVGTLMNVFRLLKLNKKAVTYAAPQKKFLEFHNEIEWDAFIKHCDVSLRRKVEQRAALEAPVERSAPVQTSFLDQDRLPVT
jgi:hypothetical protein